MLQTAVIFQDHMILQHGKEVPVWGTGIPETTVEVLIQGKRAQARVAQDGTWMVLLPSLLPSKREKMEISDGCDRISFSDVAVGEVWIAGGQSNMEFHMCYEKHWEEEFISCPEEELRFFDVPEICYEEQISDFDYSEVAIWRKASREDLKYFSAVAYYFQKALWKNLNIPVGIIGCNWAATSSSAWMEASSVKQAGAPWMKEYEKFASNTDMDAYWKRQRKNRLNGRGELFSYLFGGEVAYPKSPSKDAWEAYISYTSREEFSYGGMAPQQIPGILYEHMVKKTAPFGIRGMIWYQGESDDVPGRQKLYGAMMTALIRDWRKLWADEALPFLIVQLPGYSSWEGNPVLEYDTLRKCQEEVAKTVENVWLCSASDAGEEFNIHPKNKKVVGERLALLARGHVYQEKILCDAPEVEKTFREGSHIRMVFAHAEGGLTVKGEEISALHIRAKGIEIPFQASVNENVLTIMLEREISEEVTVSFAAGNWFSVNLYNQAGIPAIPFEKTL